MVTHTQVVAAAALESMGFRVWVEVVRVAMVVK
jgi:hypothetical protein